MSHNELPGLLLSIFSCAHITLTVSIPLARDIANKIDETYYKLGYKDLEYTTLSAPSAFSIRVLADLEWKIYNEIINYCAPPPNSKSCGAAQSYVEDYEATSLLHKNSQPEADFTKVIACNMNAIYRIIRRFREHIHQWTSYSTRSQSQMHRMPMPLLQRIKEIYNASIGPFKVDMHVATFAIPLTQFHLDLKTEDISQGIFQGRKTGIKLKAIHSLEIGTHSTATGLYPVGIEWLEHALYKVVQGDSTTRETIVEDFLNQAKVKHDKDWQLENDKDMKLVYYETLLNHTRNAPERKWRKSVTYSRVPNEPLSEKFWSLCNDNQSQTVGPLKAELLSIPPYQVIQFHDIIGPAKTTEVVNATSSKFFPAVLGGFGIFYPRIKLAGMSLTLQKYSVIYSKFEKLATRVTGLKVQKKAGSEHEPFDLTSYSPGGYNSLHHD